jgi:hypothetical protein
VITARHRSRTPSSLYLADVAYVQLEPPVTTRVSQSQRIGAEIDEVIAAAPGISFDHPTLPGGGRPHPSNLLDGPTTIAMSW